MLLIFVKKLKTLLTAHIHQIMEKLLCLTKSFKNLNLNGIWITCGSEPVEWDLIINFVKKGCKFMVNWGMTEIGPCAINTLFKILKKF